MTDGARAKELLQKLLEGEISAESLDAEQRAAIAGLGGEAARDALYGAALLWRVLGPPADSPDIEGAAEAARVGLEEIERVELGLALAASTVSRADRAALDRDRPAPLLPLLFAAPSAARAYADDARSGAASALLPAERHVLLQRDDLRVVLSREGARLVLALYADDAGAYPLTVSLDGAPLSPRETTASACRYELGAVSALRGAELGVALADWRMAYRLLTEG